MSITYLVLLLSALSLVSSLDFAVIGDYGYIYNLTYPQRTFKAME